MIVAAAKRQFARPGPVPGLAFLRALAQNTLMPTPRETFEALCLALGFQPGDQALLKQSFTHLMPRTAELMAAFQAGVSGPAGGTLLAGVDEERREQLQGMLAGFILRTVSGNFDDAYCDYVREMASREMAGREVLGLGLALANQFVLDTLLVPARTDPAVAAQITAWNRLTSALRLLVAHMG